jgi:hypothetical protein
VITEQDIIEARRRVAAAEAAGEQQDFRDALLASPDLTPVMIREWLDCGVNVRWCACIVAADTPRIVCETCGLPPFWTERKKVEDGSK